MQVQKSRQGYKIVNLTFGTYNIPKEWEVARFGNISKIKRGASPRPIADPHYFGVGRGWIRISDVTESQTNNSSMLEPRDSFRVSPCLEQQSIAIYEYFTLLTTLMFTIVTNKVYIFPYMSFS